MYDSINVHGTDQFEFQNHIMGGGGGGGVKCARGLGYDSVLESFSCIRVSACEFQSCKTQNFGVYESFRGIRLEASEFMSVLKGTIVVWTPKSRVV